MNKKSSISLFLAATSAVALSTMSVDADFILDEEAQRLADEAKRSVVCVPIGEGENCW